MACFSNITKNEHLHVRVNLDFGMRKDVSCLRHMVLVASGFLLVVFTLKEPYKQGCKNLINMVLIFHCNVQKWAWDALGSLGLSIINLLNF